VDCRRPWHNTANGGAFMANEEHLIILWSGVEKWNEWRRTNPAVKPDLTNANLRLMNLDFTFGLSLHENP
jgi:hypothetical protein